MSAGPRSTRWWRCHRSWGSIDAVISTFTVFFDANVFFGAALRSLVMELAMTGLFRARWSADVHEEWIEALLAKMPDIDRDRIRNVRAQMDRAVPDCLVSGYEAIIPSLNLPDPDDRHILAAAIVGRADCIVTFNERDFPAAVLSPYRIHTCHPDRFLIEVDGLDDGALVDAVRDDLAHYRKPPLSVEAYIGRLRSAGLPQTADYLTQMQVLLTS